EMAGVEAETWLVVADRIPQLADAIEVAGHRLGPACGVLNQDRERESAVLGCLREQLAPVVDSDCRVIVAEDMATVNDQPFGSDSGGGLCVLTEQFAARYPDSVVRRGHVEHVWRVDVDG